MPRYARGDVVIVDLLPIRGREQGANPRKGGLRPCVVVSDPNLLTAAGYYEVYTIVPFTLGNIHGLGNDLAPLVQPLRGGSSRALIPQVRTIDPERISRKVTTLTSSDMQAVADGLKSLLVI